MRPAIGVPVKAFALAKTRLGEVVEDITRAALGRALAARTTAAASTIGEVTIVTGDPEVHAWAGEQGVAVCPDTGTGLNDAASAFVASLEGERPWMLVHADLPLLTGGDLAALLPGPSIAPSLDGGTSALAGTGPIRPSYGPGSFHRHLAGSTRRVVVRPGLAIDLDHPDVLDAVRRLPGGAWLEDLL